MRGSRRSWQQHGFALTSQARRRIEAESCSLVLWSEWFSRLLPTPPHGDAVMLSSQTVIGTIWPKSSTPEGCNNFTAHDPGPLALSFIMLRC